MARRDIPESAWKVVTREAQAARTLPNVLSRITAAKRTYHDARGAFPTHLYLGTMERGELYQRVGGSIHEYFGMHIVRTRLESYLRCAVLSDMMAVAADIRQQHDLEWQAAYWEGVA